METFSGSSGPRDVGAVIAGAAVAGQVQGMFGDGFHFCRIFIGHFILCLLCGISWLHPRGRRDLPHLAQSSRAAFGTALGPAHTKEKAGQQDSKILARLSAQGSSVSGCLQLTAHPGSFLGTN